MCQNSAEQHVYKSYKEEKQWKTVLKKQEEKTDKTKTNKTQSDLITKESLCAVCALFCLFALLILCTHSLIFGEIGVFVHAFLIGLFGYLAYPVLLLGLYLSITVLIGKSFIKDRRAARRIGFTLVCAALMVHMLTT